MDNAETKGIEELVGIETVAKWLGVSRSVIARLANAGVLENIRVGSRIMFAPSAVREYIGNHTVSRRRRCVP